MTNGHGSASQLESCRKALPTHVGRLARLAVALVALLGAGAAQAQSGLIAGTVTDTEGLPLPGATVLVEGTSLGAATTVSGNFTVPGVPVGTYTLRARFLGYADSTVTNVVVRAGETTTVSISLSEANAGVGEVVVTGYGVQQREDVTGSVTSINTERLDESTTSNFAQAIQGAAPGLQVTANGAGAEGNDLSIVVRGRNSITASNSPLIVLDGIPFGGGISEISQQDIASIEILRDASAAAIYGSRGSNGVILITTKKGRAGQTRLTYRTNVGASSIANVPELYTGAEFAQFKCERLGMTDNCDAALTASELANLQAGNSTDWVGLATRTGLRQDHTVSLSGGAGGTTYYVSGSILDANGVALNDKFRRYSLRVNLDQQAYRWLRLGTNLQLVSANRGGLEASFTNAFQMNPLTTPFNEDGTQALQPWPEETFFANPLQGLLVTDDDNSRNLFSSNYLEVQLPVEGLSYRLNAGAELGSRQRGRYYGRNTQAGLDVGGLASQTNTTSTDWTLENILRYQRSFGKHNLDLTALYSAQGTDVESDDVDSQGFPNDVLTYYQANVASLVEPTYFIEETSLVSQLGRLNYNYDSRYLLTLTARRDGFSGFGDNNKYGVFPSLALGWNLDREPFFPQNRYLSRLKIRASYGQNGNQAISPYQTLARLTDDSYVDGATTLPGYRPATLGNPDLRWETTTSANLGFDFGFFSNRLYGTLDVYRARTHDLLLSRSISPVNGITSITQNIGATKNYGIEAQLTSLNVRTGSFSWTTDFNISANRNEITDLYGDGQDDVANRWFIGMPIRVNYGYQFDGIWQEGDDIANSAQPTAVPGDVRVLDANGDGEITPDDRVIIGDREPSYIAGMNNTFRYGGLSLSVFLNAVQGVRESNVLLGTNQTDSDVRLNVIRTDFWTPDNPINTYPSNSPRSNPFSVGFYENASYVRLRDVTLGYALPARLTRSLSVQNLSIQISGHNLITWTPWRGLDPELNNQRGIPLERVFSVGLNATL